jgi:rubrerythrin
MALSMDFRSRRTTSDLAIFAEEEAEEQYEQFATLTKSSRDSDLAEFFHKMAGRERRHRDQIA